MTITVSRKMNVPSLSAPLSPNSLDSPSTAATKKGSSAVSICTPSWKVTKLGR